MRTTHITKSTRALTLILTLASLPAADKSTLVLQTLDPNGQITAANSSNEWIPADEQGTQAFVYQSGNTSYVLKHHAFQGRAEVFRLNPNNTLGSRLHSYIHGRLRGNHAAIAHSNVPFFFVHDSFTGTVTRLRLEADGTLDFSSGDPQRDARWRDKNHFRAFVRGGVWMLFALDGSNGNVAIGNATGAVTAVADWTSGYTAVDHVATPSGTYRLLYKASGDPYTGGDADGELGRFTIHRVGANGLIDDETQRVRIQPGYTLMRFITRLRTGQAPDYHVLAYRGPRGRAQLMPFLSQNGTAVLVPSWSGDLKDNLTGIEEYPLANQTRLVAFTGDNAETFGPEQAERTALAVHEALSGKVVGYQLILAQSGRIIYSRAWGASRLGSEDTPMTLRTRLDLGSVSKMMTTTTLMRLIQNNTAGLALNATASRFLTGVPANSWVHGRTVRDFLTHTTGTKDQGDDEDTCEPLGSGNSGPYGMNCRPFYSTSPTIECNGEGCRRAYNNSNVTTQRKMIEYVTGVATSPELVTETHSLWGNRMDLDFNDGTTPENNALSCRIPSQTYYFARCSDPSQTCYQRNGNYWQQAQLAVGGQEFTYSCSAGGWQGSSRQMIQFLTGVRYQRFLSPEMNAILTKTEEVDAFGDPTAFGWDSPTSAADGPMLGKNGSIPGQGVASKSYIVRLPHNVDAVLLMNTLAPGAGGLLTSAFRQATGESIDLPSYVHYVNTDALEAPEVTGVDTVAVSNTRGLELRTFDTDYVVAARDNGQLALYGFHVGLRGGIEARAVRPPSGEGIRDVAITHGDHFATAAVTASGRLRLTTWRAGIGLQTLNPQATVEVAGISHAKIAKVAGSGSQGRVVAALRRDDGRMQVRVWDFDNNTDGIVARDSQLGPDVNGVEIYPLDEGATANSSATFVTLAELTGARQLRIDFWRVSAQGTLTLLDTVTPDFRLTSDVRVRRKMGIGRISNTAFFVALIDHEQVTQMASYRVGANNQVTQTAQLRGAQNTEELVVAGLSTVRRMDDGKLKVILWKFPDGRIEAAGDGYTHDQVVQHIGGAGAIFSVSTLPGDGKMILRNWDVVD